MPETKNVVVLPLPPASGCGGGDSEVKEDIEAGRGGIKRSLQYDAG